VVKNGGIVETFGTTAKQNITEGDNQVKFGTQLVSIYGFDFLAVLQ